MVRVLYDDGDLQTFFQLALIDQTAQKFSRRGSDQRNRAQASKCILIAFAKMAVAPAPVVIHGVL